MQPFITDTGESALSANVGRQVRGLAHRRAYDQEQMLAGRPASGGPAADPAWQGLFQALDESGASKVRTGEAGNMGGPGFFEQQDPNNLQRQSLKGLLAAKDINAYGRTR